MSGILKVGGSELINDNGGSGSLQWGSGVPAGSVVGSNITFFNEITSYTQAVGTNTAQYQLDAGLDIDDLEVSYTPTFSTSKLIVSGIAYWGTSSAVYNSVRIKRQIDSGTYDFHTNVMNTDVSAIPGSSVHKAIAGYSNNGFGTAGWIPFSTPFCIVDASHISTVGSTVRYKLNHSLNSNDASNKTLYLNKNYYNANDYGSLTMVSHIKIEEIAQ